MSGMLEFGREVLKAQPFSALLGAEMTRFEAGLAELTLPLSKDLTQQHGFAHGGVLAYLADNAMTFAGGSVLGNVLTQEIKINYTRPAKGECLVARATVLSSGRSQAVVRCDVFAVSGDEEKLCAAAQGTIVVAGTAAKPG